MTRPPHVEVEPASVPSGGETRVTVVVSNVTEAKMWPPARKWGIEYENITPAPKVTYKSQPPIWRWNSLQTKVTIEALLSAPEDEPQGEYYYSVAVRNREKDADDWIKDGGVIAITESPNGQ